jgi:Kef-type K+ transport system membrane component KefB
MLLEELFFEIGFILVVAAAVSMVLHKLRQPLIIAYIIAGIIVGPSLLAITHGSEIFDVMAELGVAFLLFTVGLGLNWRTVKDVGGISLATGVGQVLFTSIAGFGIGQMLGLDVTTSIYLAVTFTFSSTIIVVKLLMDRDDLDSLYGRISVGFLLVQDFIAMLLLLGLGGFTSGIPLEQVFVTSLLKGIIIMPILWAISAYVVPYILEYVAKSQELLVMFALAWCFLIAGLLTWFGFGVEIGALIAGVTLSGSVYQREIDARMRPLRDFFLIIFFVILGTRMNFLDIQATIIPTIVFSLFILVSNPLVVLLIMRSLGYHPRTGFLTGTTIAQISEFSFIVLAIGIEAGHIGNDALAIATSVALVTIAGSSYFIKHNEQAYEALHPLFKWIEPRRVLQSEKKTKLKPSKVILFGHHRMGQVLLPSIKSLRQSYTVVDFDPNMVRELSEMGEPVVYGDAGDDGFLTDIRADKARFIISTIPDASINMTLLGYLKRNHYKGSVIVTSHRRDQAERCYEMGASYVIVPSVLSGEKFTELLSMKKTQKRTWEQWRKQQDFFTNKPQ